MDLIVVGSVAYDSLETPSGKRPLYCFLCAGDVASSALQTALIVVDQFPIFQFITTCWTDVDAFLLGTVLANLLLQPYMGFRVCVEFI